MKLNDLTLFSSDNTEKWLAADIKPPAFDRAGLIERTKSAPTWVHFGAGNIFRAYLARACQELVEAGFYDKGVIAAEGFDHEIIDMAFTPFDSLFILVTLKSDGSADKKAVASITEALKASSSHEDFSRLKEIFRAESLQMASFTITEKGYSLQSAAKETPPDILYDFENGTEAPRSYMGRIAALLYERYKHSADALALVSMDNCSHNGDKLKAAVSAFAKEWEERGLAQKGFLAYINNPQKISFPWSMIDKITPAPHKDVKKMLEDSGICGMATIVTSKNSYAAPFVNAEETEYLVVEDAFPNGRPPLDKAGIIFTDRETVDKTEKMKVCTCLNPLHTALAIFGCLLGYNKISEEMKDPDLKKLVEKIGYEEGLPSVVDPVIISPGKFLAEVINVRLPNPFLPDTPQRIATDTSQKLPIRFGETVKAYLDRSDLDIANLKLIPLVFAAWLRYLMGVCDNGNSMEVSPDPLFLPLNSHIKHVRFGITDDENPPEQTNISGELLPAPVSYRERIRPILEDARIFGVNLYEAGLGEKVEDMFGELIEGAGAVRKTLQKYLNS
ncbi:MAG: mannitol dehydrogenase family protein [Oscillospiraceae bacterium]|jgi:fructuronate reductase|nr:mannitol dehydrogenase family protein [Oscillospiraceae bacterium]